LKNELLEQEGHCYCLSSLLGSGSRFCALSSTRLPKTLMAARLASKASPGVDHGDHRGVGLSDCRFQGTRLKNIQSDLIILFAGS
jgi:hypothetical protein